MCSECLEEKHADVIYALHLGDYEYRYIGKSVNHKQRFKNHIWSAKAESGFAVHRWIKKHGDAVQITIIETFTPEDLHMIDEREIFHIAQARAYYEGNLNMTDGGEGRSGYSVTEETKKRIQATKIGDLNPRYGKSPWNKGLTHTEETRQKLSAAQSLNVGWNHTSETRLKIADGLRGHTVSDESKRKMSLAKKGKPDKGKHTRWHTNRNIVKPDCTFCLTEASSGGRLDTN